MISLTPATRQLSIWTKWTPPLAISCLKTIRFWHCSPVATLAKVWREVCVLMSRRSYRIPVGLSAVAILAWPSISSSFVGSSIWRTRVLCKTVKNTLSIPITDGTRPRLKLDQWPLEHPSVDWHQSSKCHLIRQINVSLSLFTWHSPSPRTSRQTANRRASSACRWLPTFALTRVQPSFFAFSSRILKYSSS